RLVKEHESQRESFAISDDGKILVCLGTGTKQKKALVFGPDSKERTSLGPLRERTSVALSGNGKVLASYAFPHSAVQVWDVATGKEVRKVLPGAGHLVTAAALSSDGKRLALTTISPGPDKKRPWAMTQTSAQIW